MDETDRCRDPVQCVFSVHLFHVLRKVRETGIHIEPLRIRSDGSFQHCHSVLHCMGAIRNNNAKKRKREKERRENSHSKMKNKYFSKARLKTGLFCFIFYDIYKKLHLWHYINSSKKYKGEFHAIFQADSDRKDSIWNGDIFILPVNQTDTHVQNAS